MIVIDSATGSDTAASGAGPSTALTGADGSTDGAGTRVTVPNKDLTNVATDGSHAVWVEHSSGRNWGRITAKGNSGAADAFVDVDLAFAINLTGKNYAIGGKRASIGNANSYKLLEGGGAGNGDLMGGWVLQFASGHTESATSRIVRTVGDTTNGPIIIRGEAGGTRPIITFTDNNPGFNVSTGAAMVEFRFLEIRNNNGTKTNSSGIAAGSVSVDGVVIDDVKINHATDVPGKGIDSLSSGVTIRNCEIANVADVGINANSSTFRVLNCKIYNCGSHGISFYSTGAQNVLVDGNDIYLNDGDGINFASTGSSMRSPVISNNTIDDNGSDGIEITPDDIALSQMHIYNNNLTNNGAYGLKFSHANHTAAYLNGRQVFVSHNNTFGNTTAAYLPSGYGLNDPGLDPQYTNAGAGNFAIGTNLKEQGFPEDPVGKAGLNRSYVDIGSSQRQEPAGGAGGLSYPRALSGGMV